MSLSNALKKFPISVPSGAIVGLNYSGMHDTSLAVISSEGVPLYAISLERLTRTKQDGRSPKRLFEGIPWDKVSKVAISVSYSYDPPENLKNKYHPVELDRKLYGDRSHGKEFEKHLDFIPVKKVYVPHHISHAASAFWTSGFTDSTCLVYDGGMSNEEWFGGVFDATIEGGVQADQLFSASYYGRVTLIYSAVTALLGFEPLKHEGKITGLAANGKPTSRCRNFLERWLRDPSSLNNLFIWQNMYQDFSVPKLAAVPGVIEELKKETKHFSNTELAATVQAIAEEHIVKILKKIRREKNSEKLCLSGGLFANVKVNQRAIGVGFAETFISPSMSDDGTALGAALHVLAKNNRSIFPNPVKNVYWGPSYSAHKIQSIIRSSNTKIFDAKNVLLEVSKLINEGAIVAIFNGPMEFGPRALGNRSILAKADSQKINQRLNKLLRRTEFMPFAPVCCEEDANLLFNGIQKVRHAAQFMTVAVDCTKKMSELHPAVVHVDGTARPQLVTRKSNKLLYDILTRYKEISGRFALINTSFNIHEEPIVMTPADALKGFYESGIDAILLGNRLIKLKDNAAVEANYLRSALDMATLSIKWQKEKAYVNSVNAHIASVEVEQSEARASEAGAKIKEAEENMALANERVNESRAFAKQSEVRASQAEAKIKEAEVNTAQANERANKSLALAQQSETRANKAEAKIKETEGNMVQANERADVSLALAKQAETRASQAEAKIKEAEENTAQANERANKSLALAKQAETRASQAEAKIKEAEVNTAQANERANKSLALAKQAETRANKAEAKIKVAEENMVQANERADESLALAKQAETRASKAEAKIKVAEENMMQANERADESLAFAKQAELIATRANAYAEQSEELANQANTLNEQLEVEIKEARVRIAQTNTRAEDAKAQASEAHKVINQLKEQKQALKSQLEIAQRELHEVHQSNHHHWQLAEARQGYIQAVIDSRSWRATAPLRWATDTVRWFAHGSTAWLTLKSGCRPRRTAKLTLLHMRNWILMRPRIKARILYILQRFPRAKGWVKRLHHANPLHAAQPPALPITEDVPMINAPTLSNESLSHLTPRARQIYAELKKAVACHHKVVV